MTSIFGGPPIALHYRHFASPHAPLVLIHGLLRNWTDFEPLLPSLTSSWQVYAFDHRGHGGSPVAADGAYLVVDYLRDAAHFLESVVKRPAVIWGHSLGAMVAWGLAQAAPQLVRGIVIEDPPFDTMGARIGQTSFYSQFTGIQALAQARLDEESLFRGYRELRIHTPGTDRMIRLGDVRDEASLRFSAKCLRQVDPRVLEPVVRGTWLAGFDWNSSERPVPCPVLALQGDAAAGGMLLDDDLPPLRRLAPRMRIERLPGIGHLIHQTAPEKTLKLIDDFAASLEA